MLSAPEEARVTVCVEVYRPATGLNVGVAWIEALTVKEVDEVPVPEGVVTEMVPLVAEFGTLAEI